jgi:4-amino-4-deoxy-L-arabinose transferase-like glycosyltransferase
MEWKWLLVILVMALLLRLPNLGANFSGDEIDLVGPAKHFLLTGQTYQQLDCNGTPYFNVSHPPFRIVFYSLWASLFGISNVAMRMVPLLFGLLTIVLTYLLGKELYSEKVGLISAFLMAFSRYHLYASEIVTNDNTLFIFLFEMTMFLFVLYAKRDEWKYAISATIFVILSLTAKLTFILLIPAMYVFATNKKGFKKNVRLVTLFVLIFVVMSVIFIGAFNALTVTGAGGIDLSQKLFYFATITWQLTPFLAIMVALSLWSVKKTKTFWFLTTWVVLPFVMFMAGSGDAQRYFMITLPAIFILLGKYLEKFKFKDMMLWMTVAWVVIFPITFELNDVMGYYNPIYLGFFYLVAVLFALVPQRKVLLLGGAIGLCIYFAFSPGFIVALDSSAVQATVEKVHVSGIHYTDVASSKDVMFYITPQNESLTVCDQRDYVFQYGLHGQYQWAGMNDWNTTGRWIG